MYPKIRLHRINAQATSIINLITKANLRRLQLIVTELLKPKQLHKNSLPGQTKKR